MHNRLPTLLLVKRTTRICHKHYHKKRSASVIETLCLWKNLKKTKSGLEML